MKSKLTGILTAAMAVTGALAYAGSAPDATAVKIETPPRLDGKLDEGFWRQAEPLGDFSLHKDPDQRRVSDTEVRLAYDDTWLYVGLKCDNPLQRLVTAPKVQEHDGSVNTDESVEMFFDSDNAGKVYYHFLLSCFNVKAEQRFIEGQRQRETWNLPWRSAVAVNDTGWTAEAAIPLYMFVEYGDLEHIRLNICRNRREPFMDAQKVVTHEIMHRSVWRPVIQSFHEHQSFGSLAPLQPGKLQVPFLVSLERVEIKPYFTKNGENYYAVEVETRGANTRAGEVELAVTDRSAGGAEQVITRKIRQNGMDAARNLVEIPAPHPAARAITIELRHTGNGEVLQARHVENPPVLKIMDAWLNRNYYTTETTAQATAAIAMPADNIRNMQVSVQLAGRAAARAPAAAEARLEFAIGELAIGRHPVQIALVREDCRPFYAMELELIKLAPKPGLEWKIDRNNRVVLDPSGKPIFPFGPVMAGVKPADEDDFAKIAAAGCNTFFQWNRSLPATNANAFLEAAAEHGMYVVSQLETGWLPYRSADLKLPEKLLPPADAKRITNDGKTGSNYLRGYLMEAGGTHPDRTAVFGEYFEKNLPYARKVIESVKDYPNLLAYNTFDEPCDNRFFHITKYLDELRGFTEETDGYHPVMLLYSSYIPPGDEYITGGDILCTDPYWIPDGDASTSGRNTPNFVSKIVYWNDQRAQKFRQPVWIVPVGSLWSGMTRSKRVISAAEQHCQNFLAIIHGAKGLFWFAYTSLVQSDYAWQSLADSMALVKKIGPMAVQPEVRQTVRHQRAQAPGAEYAEAAFVPERDEFPDVQGRIFRDPEDGGLVLIAANSRYYPVTATFTLAGLSGPARRVFSDAVLPVKAGTFSEELEPFAVRAYRLGGKLTEPAALTIAVLRPEKIPPAAAALPNNYRPDAKNVFPNPGFHETIPGHADYVFFDAQVDAAPGAAKFGAKCLKLARPADGGNVQMGFYCAPQHEKPTPYVWSFYARGARGGEKILLRGRGVTQDEPYGKTFTLTDQWQRYWMPATIPPRLSLRDESSSYMIYLTTPGTAWFDGMQLEQGYQPTEFEE